MKKTMGLVLAVAILSFLALGMVGAAVVSVQDNMVIDPREVPNQLTGDPKTVYVTLEAREVIAELVPENATGNNEPAKRFYFWAFAEPGKKATVPGPMIRLREGDTLNLTLINNLTDIESHNIDFHAAMGPGGGATVTNVKPGKTANLQFKAMRRGAYIYHCAGEGLPWVHVAHGMYGLIQVDPPKGLPAVDKEFYVGQSDWYLTDNPVNDPNVSDDGFYNLDDKKASIEHPDYYTLNGHTKALTKINQNLSTKQGDTVRIFFVTGGPNIGANFHIIGQIFDKVYTGHPDDNIRNEETVYVAPGSAAVFELTTLVPGQFSVVDHALWRVSKGALGFLHVDPRKPATGCLQILGGGFACSNPGSWPFDIFRPIAFGGP
jgi:nitrite reductase (NO-forming)